MESEPRIGKINRNISPWLTMEDGSKEAAPVIIDIDHDNNGDLAGEDDLDDDTSSLLILFDIVKDRDMEDHLPPDIKIVARSSMLLKQISTTDFPAVRGNIVILRLVTLVFDVTDSAQCYNLC